MLMLLFVLGIVMAGFMVACCYEKPGFVKVVFLGFSLYQALYLFMAAVLFLFSAFYVFTAAALTTAVLLISCIAAFLARGRKLPKLRFNWLSYLPLFAILVLAGFFCSRNAAGVFGTGQDEGLYQARAMFYMADRNEEILEFPEYDDCLNKWEKHLYLKEIQDLGGYLMDEERLEDEGEIAGVLHGLGTFPALMALWGRLFGLRHMPWGMLSCYLLSIGNVWLVLRNMWSKKKLYANLATLLYAASPIVLWGGQNSMTEIALTMCCTALFVLLTDKRCSGNQLLGIIAAAGMCSVHIMCAVFIPLIVVLYFMSWLCSGKKQFIVSMIVSTLCFGICFTMMKLRFTRYTDGNYQRIYSMTGYTINVNNILGIVWVAVALCVLIGVYMLIRGERSLLRRAMLRAQENEQGGRAGRIASIALLALVVIGLIVQIIHRMDHPEQIPHVMILGYIMMTAYIFLPLSLAATVTEGRRLFTDRRLFVLAFALQYGIWMFCYLINYEVWKYFYYARYMEAFMFIPFVLAAYILKRLPAPILSAGAAVLLALTVWQSRMLYTAQDLTNTQYAVIEDIVSCIGENDVVLINEQGYGVQRYYTLPIKALTGADVHFVWEEDVRNQAKEYDKMYDSVYLLSLYVGKLMADPVGWNEIYRANVRGSVYENGDNLLNPFPQKNEYIDTELVLLINDREYDADEIADEAVEEQK